MNRNYAETGEDLRKDQMNILNEKTLDCQHQELKMQKNKKFINIFMSA